jgi:cysteine desulfurase
VDAAQAAGKVAMNVQQLPVDLMSLSAHKMYGPKGIGALYVRRTPRVRLLAQMHGGGHERGMRSGTLPTHQIVGMGVAAELASEVLSCESARIETLRDRLWTRLSSLDGVTLNGSKAHRVPHITNISFADVDGEILLMALKDLALSSGSACTSASVEPSYVLRAIGVSHELAMSSLRFSIGRYTSEEDIDGAVERIHRTINTLRGAA